MFIPQLISLSLVIAMAPTQPILYIFYPKLPFYVEDDNTDKNDSLVGSTTLGLILVNQFDFMSYDHRHTRPNQFPTWSSQRFDIHISRFFKAQALLLKAQVFLITHLTHLRQV